MIHCIITSTFNIELVVVVAAIFVGCCCCCCCRCLRSLLVKPSRFRRALFGREFSYLLLEHLQVLFVCVALLREQIRPCERLSERQRHVRYLVVILFCEQPRRVDELSRHDFGLDGRHFDAVNLLQVVFDVPVGHPRVSFERHDVVRQFVFDHYKLPVGQKHAQLWIAFEKARIKAR